MPVKSVVVEFTNHRGYVVPNDEVGDTSWRQYLALEWEGSATFLVYDDKARYKEITVFTQYEIENEAQAVTAMVEWAKAHEHEGKV